jgi:hypothetical protein
MRQAHIVNGVVENVIIADEGFDYGDGSLCIPSDTAGIGDAYADGVFTPQPVVVTYPTNGLNFLTFMALFTTAEQDAIVASNNTQVRLFNLMAAGAPSIDLDNPQVVGGVEFLAGLGLIAGDRVAVILSGAPPA